MKRAYLALVLIALLLSSFALTDKSTPNLIYVAVDGDDNNPGT